MTPEEKAWEIFYKYHEEPLWLTKQDAKTAAILCVQEILESYGVYKGMYDQEAFDGESKYWTEVRNHLKQMQ